MRIHADSILLSVKFRHWIIVPASLAGAGRLCYSAGKYEFLPPKPESTEGRPWGQPLKKPEGAPLNLG